jgi:hypothetical protein
MRSALEDPAAPYAARDFNIFLQGSYGNDTNIYADSDVDVVIKTNSVFYADTNELSPGDLESYNANFVAASYDYNDFKKDVVTHLIRKFGTSVKPGKKAIFVEGNGSRRDCDVLPAAQFRRYYRYNGWSDQRYDEGIVFWTTDNVRIVNYPKQHSANCTTKHQATSSWFKPSVRILKNMRNTMIERGYLAEGVAPSYFLEGMLYSVPNTKFGSSYTSTIANSINWLADCDRTRLVCANEQYMLFHPTSPVTWRVEKFEQYLTAVGRFWENFGRAAA